MWKETYVQNTTRSSTASRYMWKEIYVHVRKETNKSEAYVCEKRPTYMYGKRLMKERLVYIERDLNMSTKIYRSLFVCVGLFSFHRAEQKTYENDLYIYKEINMQNTTRNSTPTHRVLGAMQWKQTYIYEKKLTKETYICEKRPMKRDWYVRRFRCSARCNENRPTYIKRTLLKRPIFVKRGLWKKDWYMRKETDKREIDVYEKDMKKRPMCRTPREIALQRAECSCANSRSFDSFFSAHTWDWVTSHVCMSHGTHLHVPCHARGWVTSHVWALVCQQQVFR